MPDVTETVVLESLNDCPYSILLEEQPETADDIDDLSWLFAADVNENHPWIDGLLQDASDTGSVDSFTGYQSGDAEVTPRQAFAVWAAVPARGLTYGDISTPTPSEGAASQAVRILDESIDATQANCVDGSGLLASILRKIGLDVRLVMVPGHCLLACNADREGKVVIGLETTLLGRKDAAVPDDLPQVLANLPAEDQEAAHAAFVAAVGAGTGTLDRHAEDFVAGKAPDTQLISIQEARDLGIRPIASKRTREPAAAR